MVIVIIITTILINLQAGDVDIVYHVGLEFGIRRVETGKASRGMLCMCVYIYIYIHIYVYIYIYIYI